jgi:predicted GNAT superfamily acetyltransferase
MSASTPHDAGAAVAPADGTHASHGTPVEIRPLRANAEFQASVDLQRDIWGWEQAEIVPATLLHVVEYVGGLAVGAFDANDQLLGFVFGLTGPRDGELAHWSHMLGVRETARDHGVGRLLKEYQRSVMNALGVKRIYWSFDPLQAKNAYFNINRLGAAVDSYVPDMYGVTASPLHLGMATDRIVARVDTMPREATPTRLPPLDGVAILTPCPRPGDAAIVLGASSPETLLIEMPEDIVAVLDASASQAKTWRLAVREHFQWALTHGYRASAVYRDAEHARAFYVMTRS